MAVVGSAEIIVRAITNKVKSDIQKAFADARPAIQQEGRRAAKDYAGAFNQTLEQTLGPKLRKTFAAAASDAASAAGDVLGKELPGEVEDAGNAAGDAAERSLSNAGRRGGNGFVKGFLSSGFANAAVAASNQFTVMLGIGNLLAPMIAGLVGMLSTLASGLFLVGSAAFQAAGALAVLPGILGVLGQMLAAVKIGFGGVGEAMQAGIKAQDAAAQSATAAGQAAAGAGKAAAKGSAQQIAAAKALAAAQERLKNAQNEARKAQEALSKAQERAQDGAEEQANAQRMLAAAEQRKNEVMSDPNASAEQGAAAQKAVDDAKAALDAITEAREEASDKARRAAERNDAAQRKLAAAEAARNRAQKANTGAGAAPAAIQTPAIKAAQAYQQALDKLSPAAAAFVEQLLNMRDRIKDLRTAIQNEMFPPLTEALILLDDDALWEILNRNLAETGKLFGEAGLSLAKLSTASNFRSGLDKWLTTNNEILAVFTERNGEAKSGLEALASIIGKLALAIQPVTMRFVRWITNLIIAKDAAWEVGDATSGLTGRFNKAGDRAAQLGRIIGNVASGLWNLGAAGDGATTRLLDSFEKATEDFEKWTKRIEEDGTAEEYFDKVVTNLIAIGRLTRQISIEFGELGDNEGIASLSEGLIPAVENFGKIGDRLTSGEIGESLGKLGDEVSLLILKFTDVGQISTFIDTLTNISSWINTIIETVGKIPGAKALAGFILGFAAITRAVSFASKILGFFGKAIIGGPISALKTLFKFGMKIPGLRNVLGKLGNTKAGKALGLLKEDSDKAKKALEDQMVTDKAKIEVLEKLEQQAKDTAAALGRLGDEGAPGIEDAKQAAAPAVDAASDAIDDVTGGTTAPIIAGLSDTDVAKSEKKTKRLSGAFGKVGGAAKKVGGAFKSLGGGLLGLAGGPIGLILMFLPQIIKGFTALYAKSPAFRKFINGIVGGFKSIVKWAQPIIKAVGQWLVKAFDWLFTKVNKAMPTIKKVVGDVFSAISGFVTKHVVPAWNNILLPAFGKLWSVVKFVMPLVGKIIGIAFKAIKLYVTKIIIPIFKRVFGIIRALWPIVKGVFDKVKDAVSFAFSFIKKIWKGVLAPVFSGIGKAIEKMRDAFSKAFDKIKGVFDTFKTAFGKVWDFVKTTVDKIKNAFGTVKDAIGNAFSGLKNVVREGINTFIRFINSGLIGPLNKVTSKFGLDIDPIKTFASGGKVSGPGSATSDSIAARLSNGEFVIKTSSAKGIGYKNLEYINKTGQFPAGSTDGVGGLIGWAADAIGKGAGAVAEGVEYLGKKGAGAVLGALVKAARGAVSGLGLDNFTFVKDFADGILKTLEEKVRSWGGDKGKDTTRSYNGEDLPPVKGWGYPLAQRYPITQMPNQGHSPTWAVDIGSPTGVAVRAVAAGVVSYLRDYDSGTSYGRYIKIAHADGTTSLYAHLEDIFIKMGQKIAAGKVIGLSGHSGGVRSSSGGDGSHLHFELMPGSNTLTLMRTRGVAFAKGGVARATNGGIPGIFAEAGKDERVEPLDKDGMSKRDRVIIAAVTRAASGGGRNINITVNNPDRERASTSVSKAMRSKAIAAGWGA